MNKVQIVLNATADFESEACTELFEEVFGIDEGAELYEYFEQLSFSILNLWRQLSKENQVKLATWIDDNLDDLRGL